MVATLGPGTAETQAAEGRESRRSRGEEEGGKNGARYRQTPSCVGHQLAIEGKQGKKSELVDGCMQIEDIDRDTVEIKCQQCEQSDRYQVGKTGKTGAMTWCWIGALAALLCPLPLVYYP